MLPPKEPKSFKHPRVYYNFDADRLRIITPDGHAEWSSSFAPAYESLEWLKDPRDRCCFAYRDEDRKIQRYQTGHAVTATMRWYDRVEGYGPAEFLGELK